MKELIEEIKELEYQQKIIMGILSTDSEIMMAKNKALEILFEKSNEKAIEYLKLFLNEV